MIAYGDPVRVSLLQCELPFTSKQIQPEPFCNWYCSSDSQAHSQGGTTSTLLALTCSIWGTCAAEANSFTAVGGVPVTRMFADQRFCSTWCDCSHGALHSAPTMRHSRTAVTGQALTNINLPPCNHHLLSPDAQPSHSSIQASAHTITMHQLADIVASAALVTGVEESASNNNGILVQDAPPAQAATIAIGSTTALQQPACHLTV